MVENEMWSKHIKKNPQRQGISSMIFFHESGQINKSLTSSLHENKRQYL